MVLARLQQIHDRWEMRSAAMFLMIAWKGEVSKPDLERIFTMGSGSSSRNIVLMEDALLVRTDKVRGVTVVRLTEFGRGVAEELQGIVRGAGD
jgi:hypothetical protein